MSTRTKYNPDHLNDLLNLKEQEWRCALQEHIDTLVKELAEKDELLRLEKVRFNKLKDDFKYNLQLVGDRDKDLQKYEQLFEQMKGNDKLNNQQVSEMKIKVDEFQNRFNLLQKEKEEMQHHYQMRLKHYQEEMTKFYAKKEDEHQKERNEYEELKRKLQRKIRDTEEELEFEKQKMLKELEENARQKEQEFQIKLDQNEADIHAYELKVKMLSRELEMVQNSNKEVIENLENNKENATQYSRLLKEKEWELQDMRNMKELKIRELECQLEEVQKGSKWKIEEFERKYCELEKLSNEREGILTTLKIAADNSEMKLREDLKIALQQKEEMELNYKRLQWQITDMQVANDKQVQSHSQRAEQLEKNLKEEIDMMNKETVAKDMEIQALISSEELFQKETVKLKNVVERLKKELTSSMDRERILENAKVQLELDWRRRFETKETDLYKEHDDLIKKLTDEKEEATRAKKQIEMELRRRENLIKLLEDDKAIAIKSLSDNGINTENIFADGVPERDFGGPAESGNTKDLKKQNSQLKEVIKEMRSEMEMLSQQITSNTSTPNKMKEEKSSYVQDMEAELQKLKSTNRNLMLKLEDATREDKPPLEGIFKSNVTLSDPGIKNYVKELNETIGALRNDKVLITASLNSKDATINHLNEMIGKLTNEKQQQAVQIDNLNFDMSSKTKAFEQNITSLKSRISELDLHLQQARSEAEIYYKSVMERNSDATQANNKLSELKIQNSAYTNISSNGVPDLKPPSFYKDKLKLAVERIKELAVERSQLINLGNKLRFELNRIKETYQLRESEGQDDKLKSSNMRNYGEQLQTKLDKLERMEYEATVNELRNAPKKKPNVDIKFITSSTEISEITDDDAPSLKESAKENQPPSYRNQQPISLLHSSSEHSSINEIWKMLENAEDVSSIPDKDQSDDLALVGKHIKPDARKALIKSPVLKQKKLTKIKKKAIIRNYNQKNDKK